MKNLLFICLLMASAISGVKAQWINSVTGTSQNLRDIHFLNPDTGIVAGDNQTLLISTDGGITWDPVSNPPAGNIYSVRMISTDSIIVTVFNPGSQSGTVHFTADGGLNWQVLLTDNATGHQLDLEIQYVSKMFITGNALMSNDNFGTAWDTLVENTSSTTMLDLIRFADSATAHLSGLVSGIVSYSACFHRSEDGGATWFPGDPFSFPNSDALTTMCFIHADTAIVFTNDYAGFSPSNSNGVVQIHGFNKFSAFPGDTVFTFSSSILTSASPAYITDAYFANRDSGYAVSSNGKIYKTLDGGANWIADYNGTVPLNAVSKFGYAAGDNGTVLRLAVTSGIPEKDISAQFILYPNPANDKITILTHSDIIPSIAEIRDSKGSVITTIEKPGNKFQWDIRKLKAGNYVLQIKTSDGSFAKLSFVKL